jgi:hypothetical protein
VPEPTAAELQALGLYDPKAPHAAQMLELLTYLAELGATREDLMTFREGLPGLASVLAIRGGAPLTLEEAVDRSGISEHKSRHPR